MIDPQIVSAYERAIKRRGQSVTFRRVTGQAGQGRGAKPQDAMVTAIVMNYQPGASVMPIAPEGAVTLGEKTIVALETDLRIQQFPLPLRKNDKVLVDNEWLNIEAVDPNTKRLAGAIEVRAQGTK